MLKITRVVPASRTLEVHGPELEGGPEITIMQGGHVMIEDGYEHDRFVIVGPSQLSALRVALRVAEGMARGDDASRYPVQGEAADDFKVGGTA